MVSWFLESIGTSDDVLKHLDRAKFSFQREEVFWGGLVLLLPVAYYIYRRQRENLATVPMKWRFALSATRVLILLVLIFVLAGPYLRVDHKFERKPIVAFLFDHSQSMQLPAGPYDSDADLAQIAAAAGYETQDGKVDAETRKALNRISRADLAQSVVRGAREALIEPLSGNYDVRYASFSRESVPLAFDPADPDSPLGKTEAGSASYLGDAVFSVLEEAAGRTVSAVLLFSDGQNTGGRSPAEAARAAAQAGVPVYTVPVGSVQRIRDVSIVDLYTSGLVSVGDTARVAVTLESQGFNGRPVKVELRDGETVLDTKELVLLGTEQQQTELTFEAKEPGTRYLTVNVPPFPEESEELRSNNADLAFIRVSEEKLRVLFVDGLPRWDFRFLKNALRRDNGLAGRSGESPDIVLEAEWRRLSAEQQAAALPRTPEEIAEYHTVIVGDASPKLLRAEFRELLAEAVREKGVGLVVAAGPLYMPHAFDEQFVELLPVQLRGNAAGLEAPAYNPFRIEVSPEGVIHEAMRLYDDPGRNQNVWGRMPPYYWCAAAERPSPAATVLAWNPSVEGRFGKMPLIAYQYAGQGKVMFVGTDSTWLWRQNVGDRFFYKFWGQMIRFVARRADSEAGGKTSIAVRPIRAQPGEQAEVELMAFNQDGTPRAESKLKVTVTGPGSTQIVELTADKSKQGRYTGHFIPEAIGEHRVMYQSKQPLKTYEAKIRVMASSEELRDPNLNRPLLEMLAGTTNGQVVALPDLKSIPEKLKGEATLIEVHREASVWDNWLTLVFLSLVYSIDVALRRLMGLS